MLFPGLIHPEDEKVVPLGRALESIVPPAVGLAP